jgi:dihydrofolate synthase/folylpolyglutamate synthase
MGFDEAEHFLDQLGIDAMKSEAPTLHRIEAICDALDHPERGIPTIHITGTNGKTSTARLVTALLVEMGLSVGTYTSPHLQSITERLSSSGDSISEQSFGDVFDHILPYVRLVESETGERLTFFEVLTAMFFLWAAESSLDALVVEVGLGGRWDATNVVDGSVSVITNVGIDHAGLLGNKRTDIAREKAGIIKRNGVAVTAERSPDVLEVIAEHSERAGAAVSLIDRDWKVSDNRVAVGGRYISLGTSATQYEGLYVPLHGAHQGINAGTAVEALTRFAPAKEIEQAVIANGLARAVVPGRLETLPSEDGPAVVLDVAHNPDGVAALVQSLAEAFAFERVVFVVGILADKDYRGMFAELTRLPAMVVVTEPKGVRPVPVGTLEEAAAAVGLQCATVADPAAAVRHAAALAGPSDLVCVTGSHYVVGEVRSSLAPAITR